MAELSLNIKEKSHREILNTIRMCGEVSGAQLARLKKLQPSTLVYILRSLEKAGLIEMSRIGISTVMGGKPPKLWRLVAEKGYTIGLEIVPNVIRMSVTNFACKVIHQQITSNIEIHNSEQIVSSANEIIFNFIKNWKLSQDKIIGVGIAIPGLVDSKQGLIHFSIPFLLKDIPLGKMLKESLNLPVIVANDANAGALGVTWYQNNTKILPSNIVYLTINELFRGIGAGLIINGQLYEGISGTAGEIYEELPNLNILLERGKKEFKDELNLFENFETDDSITLADIVEYTKKNCRISNFVIRNIGKIIAKEIKRIINFINPELIVIGGDIASAEFLINDYILPTIKKKSSKFFPTGVKLPNIVFSKYGIYSVSMGATALIFKRLFNID
jgi:predicted NBD/HSP70 family sugar kinase